MDKTQLKDLLKSIKGSLPKELTVTVQDEKDQNQRTFTSNVNQIVVGKGYGGTYTATFENNEIITSRDSDRIISISMNGTVYNKQQEKKQISKVTVDEAHAKSLLETFSTFKIGDKISIESTEAKFNNKFIVTNSDAVHAPIKQHRLGIKKIDNSGSTYLLSRRDSNVIKSASLIRDDLKDGEEEVNEISSSEEDTGEF